MEDQSRDIIYRLYNLITLANEGLELFSPSIDHQLRLFESSDLIEETDNKSLGYSISNKLKELDGNFISGQLKDGKLEEFLSTLNGRFVFEEGGVQNKLKSSGTYNDPDRPPLTVQNILAMSDLEILSEINAYQNPYSGHKQGRSSYEYFFNDLIFHVFKPVALFHENSPDFIRFQVIHETMYILHLISQNATSIIEIVLAIIKNSNIRIKTSGLSIRMDLRLPEFTHPIIDNSIENFQQKGKIYQAFRNHNFNTTISKLSDEDITWLNRIEKFQEILFDTLHATVMQTETVFQNVVVLKNMLVYCKESYVELEIYLSDLLLFIVEFQLFIQTFLNDKNGYIKFYQNLHKLLEELENLEREYPTVYGGYTTPSPRTPSNQPSARQNLETRPTRSNPVSRENSPMPSPHPIKPQQTSLEMRLDLSKLNKEES